MAGGPVILPADPWERSDVTEEKLQLLVEADLLRPITDPDEPEWIAPGDESEPRPRDGYVVSFVVFHERGFGLPADSFMRALPHYYGVELHNFSPNSIAQAAIFVAVCEGYLGIAPHWELWLHLFRATFTSKPGGTRGARKAQRAGGCTLHVRQDRQSLYIPAQLATSNRRWYDGWFYLRNDGGGLPPYTGRVVESQPEKWGYGVVKADQPGLEPLLRALGKLRDHGLSAAVVVAAFHRRRVLPLMARRRRLFEMTPGDSIAGVKMSAFGLTDDEILRRVREAVDGKPRIDDLMPFPMRPSRGYVSLVSWMLPRLSPPSCFSPFLSSYFVVPTGDERRARLPAARSRGRPAAIREQGARRGGEEEERCQGGEAHEEAPCARKAGRPSPASESRRSPVGAVSLVVGVGFFERRRRARGGVGLPGTPPRH